MTPYPTIVADPPWPIRDVGTWHRWPRAGHSVKPDSFFDLVESVSPGPYLELFARRERVGWHSWGNESIKSSNLSLTNL
jgi:N6-adenosine-specific RNA methylase IME4